MAERRSIYKKISLSESVDQVSNWGQLFFSWSIAHADDVGLLPRSAKVLRGMIFPLKEAISTDQVEKIVQECIKADLYIEIDLQGKNYLYLKNFNEHQTLKKDRQPNVIFDFAVEGKPKDSWEKLDHLVSKWNPNGIQMDPEEKGREEKGKEIKGIQKKEKELQNQQKYLLNVPEDDIKQMMEKYEVSRKKVIDTAEALHDWCLTTGKRKKDYKAFLRNGLRNEKNRIEERNSSQQSQTINLEN